MTGERLVKHARYYWPRLFGEDFRRRPEEPGKAEINSASKQEMLSILAGDCALGKRKWPVLAALHHYAASVRAVTAGELQKPEIPTRSVRLPAARQEKFWQSDELETA